MIEQLHYATTSRYNFLQTLEEEGLPKRFLKLSLNSMLSLKGKHFQPYETDFLEPFTERQQCDEAVTLNGKAFSTLLLPLKPIRDGTPIIAIDASSIRVGETESGFICAVRGAVVLNENMRYRYYRLGPFPFHISEESMREILCSLGKESYLRFREGFSSLLETQSNLCSGIERWIQMSVANSSGGSIILWDGTLAAGSDRNSVNEVSHILDVARKNSNSVLSFSKDTGIRFLGRRITDMALNYKPPYLFEVEDLPLPTPRNLHLLGKIYVAKLANGGYPFRLDIDRALTPEMRIMAVQKVLGNELTFQGYPETLRLAHIFSTFTANDILGIQRFIAQEYGLRVNPRPNMRRALFGPYGTGFED